jgi:hypothetical protein
MHLDEERLQRLLDGEMDGAAASSARTHLDSCDACRGQVAAAERERAEVTLLLGRLDCPIPLLSPDDVMARAGSAGLGWARRAAVVILGLGLAGVAYAAPGSPLPGWLRTLTGQADRAQETPPAGPRAPAQADESVVSGIAVAPGSRLVIVFPSPPAGARAQVSLSDTSEVVVRALTGRASFSSGTDRLVVETADSAAAFQVVVPRTAPSLEIRAGETTLFRKHGSRITAATDSASGGTYLIPLAPPAP